VALAAHKAARSFSFSGRAAQIPPGDVFGQHCRGGSAAGPGYPFSESVAISWRSSL
jgi:hypothetical protein